MKITFNNFVLTAACLFSVALHAAATDDLQKLIVVFDEEKAQIIPFTDKSTIRTIKHEIYDRTGILAEEQRLYTTIRTRGRYALPNPYRIALEDDKLCSAYDLHAGAVVECVIHLRRHSH